MQWENLETWVRDHVQGFIQQVLEQEVSEFLRRQKSQRRALLDKRGYWNGYGKPRRLTDPELWHHHGPTAAGAGHGNPVCQSGVPFVQAQEHDDRGGRPGALSAWAGSGGL